MISKKIAVTTTAVLRPEILERTFESFNNFLDGKNNPNIHLFLNIDNIGGTINDREKIIFLCQKYFQNFTLNQPVAPNFSKAFKWCWEQVDNSFDYVFNLEDDWELTDQNLRIETLIEKMEQAPTMANLRLSYKIVDTVELKLKQWNKFFSYNIDGFFECPERHIKNCGFCGHPSLFRAEFVRNVAKYINTKINPEKQFHHLNDKIIEEVLKWRWGAYVSDINSKIPLIKDIGRDWIKDSGLRKKGVKAFFTEYQAIGV